MSGSTSTTVIESKSLALDAPGMGVDAAAVEEFSELAALGLVGTGANNSAPSRTTRRCARTPR